jgi:hypothetical protein
VEGYVAQRLFSAGDAVERDAAPYADEYPSSAQAEKFAGGNHAAQLALQPALQRQHAVPSSSTIVVQRIDGGVVGS